MEFSQDGGGVSGWPLSSSFFLELASSHCFALPDQYVIAEKLFQKVLEMSQTQPSLFSVIPLSFWFVP